MDLVFLWVTSVSDAAEADVDSLTEAVISSPTFGVKEAATYVLFTSASPKYVNRPPVQVAKTAAPVRLRPGKAKAPMDTPVEADVHVTLGKWKLTLADCAVAVVGTP